MDQKLLNLVIELLLRQPAQRVVPSGYPMFTQPSFCNLDAETITAMRDLIAERITSNASTIADAFAEHIKRNYSMNECDTVMFELCDEVVSPFKYTMTQQVSPSSPDLNRVLAQVLQVNFYNFAQLSKNAPDDVFKYRLDQLSNYVYNIQIGINGLIQAILSSKPYDPFTILRNCNSKVVILHDGPDKVKLRAIADEKKMVVLTDSMKRERSEYPRPSGRPELMLLLMLNAYNSVHVAKDHLFPKQNRKYVTRTWATDIDYLDVEQYINNTIENYVTCSYSIRNELERKAPEFLKDFDEDLAIIHGEDAHSD